MLAICKGGPYDGTHLDRHDVDLYCKMFSVGIRKFILLPALENWDAVRASAIDKSEAFNKLSPLYEVIRYPDRMEAVFDPTGGAMGQAHQAEMEGRGPKPVMPPFRGAFYQCFRGDWLSGLPGWTMVVDEKGRSWAYREIGHEGWNAIEPDDYSQIQARHDELQVGGGMEEVSFHADSPKTLPTRLADFID